VSRRALGAGPQKSRLSDCPIGGFFCAPLRLRSSRANYPEHLFHLPMAREPLDVKTHIEVNEHIQTSLPTNQVIEVRFIHIMRIKDGLNAEEWDEVNFLPLMKALNVVPQDAGIDWH
jgi:hypothetical protein